MIVALGLGASYALVYSLGGAGRVAPHVFYLPILFAGVRFGAWGSALVAIVSMILAGPLMPLDVETGVRQHQSDWLSRGIFFLAVGPFFSAMVTGLRKSWEHELEIAEKEREMAVYKANILQNLSHELRSPLTVILGTARTLTVRGLVEGEALSLMEGLLRAAVRLEEMIGIALAAVGAKERRKRILNCEIKPIVDSVCRSLSALNATERVHLEPEVAMTRVTTDPEILKLMLRCLIDNALKFSPSETPVSVRCQRGDDVVEIAIKDKGPGLSEEYAKRAFEAFTQQDASLSRAQGGLGIGLYAARKLAEEIKGEVDLVNPADGGTEAVIRIPRSETATEQYSETRRLVALSHLCGGRARPTRSS